MIRILALADLHCGNVLGLTPPEHWSEETRELQEPLWENYKALVAEVGKVDITVINGDAVDGEGKKETLGLFCTDTKKQADIAADCLYHIQSGRYYVTYGTPFHTVGTYNYEDTVADLLDTHAEDTLLLKIHGKKFNFRHVCGRSDIPYGQGTQIQKEIVRELLSSITEEYEAADYLFRAHVHYYCRVETEQAVAETLPALKIPDGVFGRKLRTMYYNIGMQLIEIDQKGLVYLPRPMLVPIKIVKRKEYICLDEKTVKKELSKSRKRSSKS